METPKDLGMTVLAILFTALLIVLLTNTLPFMTLQLKIAACVIGWAPTIPAIMSFVRSNPPDSANMGKIFVMIIFPLTGWVILIKSIARKIK